MYETPMATFVLVHGACGGGWEWARVAAILRGDGHQVHTPTLTGLGDRSPLLTREVNLEQHVLDVTEVLFREDLRDVILSGHSYGGMVTPGVADREPERIARLVCVDGFVPRPGQSARDLVPADQWDEVIVRPAEERGDGWRVPAWGFEEEVLTGLTPERRRWYVERLVDQPLATLTQPLTLPNGFPPQPGRYVQCERGAVGVMESSRAHARELGWVMRTIDAQHDVQVTDPPLIAAVLQEIAGDVGDVGDP